MKIALYAIGKIKSQPLQELVADYSARLQHYIPFERRVFRAEGAALDSLKAGDLLIGCDERGKTMTSQELATFVEHHASRGTKRLVFFVGDAEGHSASARATSHQLLALSAMTLPHELCQVVLLEQLYRAFTIIRGEKYHRA